MDEVDAVNAVDRSRSANKKISRAIAQTPGNELKLALRTGVLGIMLWAGALSLAGAAPVTAGQAERAVRAWLARTPEPLGERIGPAMNRAQAFRNAQGEIDFYIVSFKADGYVIVAADDTVEPIVGFFPKGRFDASEKSAVGFLVKRDLGRRMSEAREKGKIPPKGGTPQLRTAKPETPERGKWGRLLLEDNTPASAVLSDVNEGLMNDVRVGPLVAARWGQGPFNGIGLYNYYTPPYEESTAINYPTGCLATAMAQLMWYHRWPLNGVETRSYEVQVDGKFQWLTLRGGDGAGGPYAWASMPADPKLGIVDAQRLAIGALMYDAAVAIETQFAADESGAIAQTARTRLKEAFQFSNAIYSSNYSGGWWSDIGAALPAMVNPNLDAGLPVILSIRDTPAYNLHAVVCDGYGYNGGTIYHHCNLGWGGDSNGWYNLPFIGTINNFNMVFECLYNIYTHGGGELISGRVTDAAGQPIPGATMTATTSNGTVAASVLTGAKGIFALKNMNSSTTYTLTAAANTYVFTAPRTVVTGDSDKEIFPNPTAGNVWGANFQAQPDAWPRVWITSATTSRREGAGVVTLIVRRNAAPAYASLIDIQAAGTATPGTDYTLSTTTVAIAAGQTTASFGIVLVNDTIGEPVKTVQLTLTPRTACLPGPLLTHTLTIVDDDNFLAESLDDYVIFWQVRGDAPWIPQTATSHDGVDAAQSGTITAGQTSTLYSYVTGPGTLGFWWRVAAPAGDTLIFNDNGTTASISGDSGFVHHSATIGAGIHLLQWTLRRAAGSTGAATGWVDQINWSNGVPPAITPAPYYGYPAPIPGLIEAEDFDLGGNSSAYFDNTAGNAGGFYRPDEDVDIYECSDLDRGFDVSGIAPDEWLDYTVGVNEAGLYTLWLRVASAAGGRCRLELSGADLAGEIAIPATGSAWQTVTLSGIALPAGTGVLKFKTATGGFNLNRIEFVPEMGAVKGLLDPPEAITAGAKWRRKGTTAWRVSGASDPSVPAGNCTVEFLSVPGFNTPPAQQVWINKDQTTTVTGHYARQFGFLYVGISPTAAAQAGGMWRRVGTQDWLESGALEGVYSGPYAVEFKTAYGWKRPANLNVKIAYQQTVTTTGFYIPAGSLNVNIYPGIAAGAGGKWRRVGTTPWLASGAIEEEVPAGEQTVEFWAAAGWSAPGPKKIIVGQGQFVQESVTFTRQTGGLKVTLGPTGARDAGAAWRRSGTTPWLVSGATEGGLLTGVYAIEFKAVPGWRTPANLNATVQNNTTATLSASYTSLSAVGWRSWTKY